MRQGQFCHSGRMRETTLAGLRVARLLGSSWQGTSGPAYRSLADGIRLLVLDGRVPPGSRMPGERELAAALQVSRTTVSAAYDLLRRRGFLVSRRGSGTRASLPARGASGPAALMPTTRGSDGMLDLARAALEAPAGLAAAVATALEALPEHLSGPGYQIQGVPSLREALARRYTERGLPTSPDQVVVTGGALPALALLVRTLVGPGDRVLVEHPTYPNALDAIRAVGARPVPVAIGAEGWDVTGAEAALRQSAPALAYLVPEFHNPTGALMDPADREALARALARTRTPVVVDETLVDLGLDVDEAGLPAPFATFAGAADTVVTIGSASKSFWGGLGIGWLRAPEPLVDRLLAARVHNDLGTPVLEQLTVAALLEQRDELLAARRDVLRARRDALVGALREHLPTWRFDVPVGGLALWCELDRPVSSALAATAAGHGVRLAAGPRFGVDGAFERFVRLPYTLPEEPLREAVAALAAAHAAVVDVPRPRLASVLTA